MKKRFMSHYKRRPAILKFVRVAEIPPRGKEESKEYSKYSPYLKEIAKKKRKLTFKVRNGKRKSGPLLPHLKRVCKKEKIKNLTFESRKGNLYCQVN